MFCILAILMVTDCDKSAETRCSVPDHLQLASLLGYPKVNSTLKILIGTHCTVSVFVGIPVLVRRRRHIKRWVAIKESHWLERKPNIADGHHRPIFGPRYMMFT